MFHSGTFLTSYARSQHILEVFCDDCGQFHSGLLRELCALLLAVGIPVEILMEAIVAVAEVIRANQANQDYFGSILAPSEPPKSVPQSLFQLK